MTLRTKSNKQPVLKKISKQLLNDDALTKTLETLPISVIIFNDAVILFVNKETTKMFSLSRSFLKSVGNYSVFDFILPQYHTDIKYEYSRVISGQKTKGLEVKIKNIQGKIFHLKVKSTLIIFKNKKAVQTIFTNVTEEETYKSKLKEETLRVKQVEKSNNELIKEIWQRKTAEAKLQTVFNTSTHIIWTIDRQYNFTSFNQNYIQQLNDYYQHHLKSGDNLKVVYKKIIDKKEYKFWIDNYQKAFSGDNVLFETEKKTEAGISIHREINLNPVFDENKTVIEVVALSHNISERKKNEQRLTQSLKEKEVLLKEVHHRVKNNMQVISSILNLQSSYIKDEYAVTVLKESQNRIKTMAFVHESLYQTKNFQYINFPEYVSTLSKNLVSSYSFNTKKVKLILSLCPLSLNIDISIPCGLIINEIISNSLKYAFPNNRDGIIFVNLTTVKNQVCIELKDNGVGIPRNINIKNTNTLGLQLVNTLIEQINGSLMLKRDKGTTFIIKFKN